MEGNIFWKYQKESFSGSYSMGVIAFNQKFFYSQQQTSTSYTLSPAEQNCEINCRVVEKHCSASVCLWRTQQNVGHLCVWHKCVPNGELSSSTLQTWHTLFKHWNTLEVVLSQKTKYVSNNCALPTLSFNASLLWNLPG